MFLLLIMFVFSAADLENFSASQLPPARHATPMTVTHRSGLPAQHLASVHPGNEGANADSDDAGVETEKEWLDEEQLAVVAKRFQSSKNSDVIAIEVCLVFFF